MADDPADRLSQLATSWTLLRQAHDPADPRYEAARRYLLDQYGPFVRRYLAGALRHEPNRDEAINDAFQEFALRFARGALGHATPDRGRFRNYLKTCLFNIVTDHRRGNLAGKRPQPLADHDPPAPAPADDEAEYRSAWQEEFMGRAIRALETVDAGSGRHLYTVLKLRLDRPDLRSEDLAAAVAPTVGKAVSPVWVRKRLSTAKSELARLLVQEVRASLGSPTREELEAELIDLGLFEHCRSALGGRD